jgi:hypothetical protein
MRRTYTVFAFTSRNDGDVSLTIAQVYIVDALTNLSGKLGKPRKANVWRCLIGDTQHLSTASDDD